MDKKDICGQKRIKGLMNYNIKELGMKEKEPSESMLALKKTLCIMIRITVGLALLFSIVTFLFPELIMRMFTTEPEVIAMGARYFHYSFITYFFLGLSLTCTIVLRSVGQVKIPLLVYL